MTTATDRNQVRLTDDNIIEVTLVGNQTDETFKSVYYEAEPLIEELVAKQKPVLIIIDMTRETGYSLSSDKAAMEILESVNYTKLAMFNPPHRKVVEGIVMAIGKSDSTKVFSDRVEALAWLLPSDM